MVFIHNGFWQNGSCCTRDCGVVNGVLYILLLFELFKWREQESWL